MVSNFNHTGIILILVLGSTPFLSLGQGATDTRGNAPVPYTLADRERLIKLEVQVEAFQNETKLQFNQAQKDIEELKAEVKTLRNDISTLRSDVLALFMWGFGLIFSSIVALVSFIMWDRRTFNREILKKVEANKNRLDSVERKLVFKP